LSHGYDSPEDFAKVGRDVECCAIVPGLVFGFPFSVFAFDLEPYNFHGFRETVLHCVYPGDGLLALRLPTLICV
jgi:hypothetical protein